MINVRQDGRDQLVRFLVDFSAIEKQRRIQALGRYASKGWESLKTGDFVLLYDGEGNEYVASIEERRPNGLFSFWIDLDTWQSGDSRRFRMVSGVPHVTPERVPAGLHG